MEPEPGLLKRNPIAAYFVLAYVISWLFWLPLAASSHDLLPVQLSPAVFYSLGALGPALAAIMMSAVEGGKPAVRALLGKVLKWRASLWWYLAALVAYPGLSLAGVGLGALLGDQPIRTDPSPLHLPYWFLLVLNPPFVLCEEIGWRGYALPRMQRGRSALLATFVLTLLWGFWHVPSFLTKRSLLQGVPFPFWLVWLFLMAIIETWLYNGSGGSVLFPWLFHAVMNYSSLIPHGPKGQIFASLLVLVWVLLILLVSGPSRLGRKSVPRAPTPA